MRSSLALAVVLAVATPAVCAAQTYAVLGLEAVDAPEADAARLTDAMRTKLASQGVKLSPDKKDFVEMKLVFGCMDDAVAACMAQAGKSLGADKLIYGTLKGNKATPGKLSLAVRVLDVKSAAIEKFVPSEALTSDDLAAGKVDDVAARILGKLTGGGGGGAGGVTITTEPAGADVTVDGMPRGPAPVTVSGLSPGAHTVVVAKDGFQSHTEGFEVKPGETGAWSYKLEPGSGGNITPPPVTEAPAHPGRTLKIVGIVGLVLAAAIAGVSIYTWRAYLGKEDDAHAILAADPGHITSASWRQNPQCSTAADNFKGAQLNQFESLCNDGQSLANTTTGLIVGASVLAVGGAVALILGIRQADKAKEHAPTGFAPRLRAFEPSAGPRGGGFTATFEF